MLGSKIFFRFNERFIKNCNEESDEVYLEKLKELHNDSPFLPKRIKIQKVEKFVANLLVIHIRSFKKALNYKLVSKKDHKVIKFNQKA